MLHSDRRVNCGIRTTPSRYPVINKELLAVISKSKNNQGRLDLEPSSFTISCALIHTLVLPLTQFDYKHRHDADQTPPQRPRIEYLGGIVSSWLYLERSSTHRHSSLRLSTTTRAGSSCTQSLFPSRSTSSTLRPYTPVSSTMSIDHSTTSTVASDRVHARATSVPLPTMHSQKNNSGVAFQDDYIVVEQPGTTSATRDS